MEPITSILGGIVLGWLGDITLQGGEAGLRKILSKTPAQRAIKATAEELPFIPTIEPALKKWSESDEFAKLLSEIHVGRVESPSEALIESFISVGEFYHGIGDPTEDAARVLQAFDKNLIKELLMGSTGPVVAFARGEEKHREILERFDEIEKKLKQETSRSVSARRLPTFVKAPEFFRPYLRRHRLFHHAWRTVGRYEVVAILDDFVKSGRYQIALMMGPTGVGKTKIVFAFARGFKRRNKDYELRFVAPEATISELSFDELPETPCVVIVEDAHKREDLKLLLEGVQRRTQPTKIILISRSWALWKVEAQISDTSYDPSEIIKLPEVQSLNHEELTQLAAQALGKDYAGYAEQLAEETKESPLFTVLGGQVLAKEKIAPKLLLSSKDFIRVLLARYSDLILGEISSRFGIEISRNLIELLAALSPIGYKDEALLQAMANFLEMDRAEMITAMDSLEEGGVLVRHGYLLKISPDFIAEYFLEVACLTSRNELTDYADEIFERFGSFSSTRLFRNLAELDWRVRNSKDPDTKLFDSVWRKKEEEFHTADHFRRKTMLEGMQEIAFIQPKRVLALSKYAMYNPASEPDDEEHRYFSFTHERVLQALPPVLERVAWNEGYLTHCCELLLELIEIKGESGPAKAAVQALQNLARYGTYPRIEDQRIVLGMIEIWLEKSTPERVYPALDVVDQVLRKADHVDYTKGAQFVSQAFTVRREPVRELREYALHIIKKCMLVDKVRVVLRALKSLDQALSDPSPIFEQKISDEDRLQWLPEQMQIFEIIDELVTHNGNPFVQLGVANAVGWEAIHSPIPEIKKKAREIIDKLTNSYEMRLAQALNYEFDYLHLRMDLEAGDEERPLDLPLRAVNEMCIALADEFVTRNPEPAVGLTQLNLWMRLIDESGWKSRTWTLRNTFLEQIADRHPEYAAALCEQLVDEPDCQMAPRSGDMLLVLRSKSSQPALDICRRFLEMKHQSLSYAVAQSFASGTWIRDVQPEDLENFKELLNDLRPAVKKVAINSIPLVFHVDPDLALELAVKTDTSGDDELTSELVSIFNKSYKIDPDVLSDEQLRAILSKLEPLNDLSRNHRLDQFLTYASERMPLDALKMFINRLRRKELGDFSYRPIPDYGLGGKLKGIALLPNYPEILRNVRDLALAPEGKTMFELPKLFKALSLDFNEEGLKSLNEWIDSGDSEKVKAALLLLNDAEPPFSFKHIEFVTNALRKAEAGGEEYNRIALSVFSGGAIPTQRHRVFGEPPPSVVHQLEQASSVLKSLCAGTPEYRFYESILKDAEKTLEEEEASDETLLHY